MSPCQPALTGAAGVWGSAVAGSSPRLTSAAITGDARVGQPQAFGRLAGLPEHVDRHAAARIPVAADPEPAWRQHLGESLADRQRAGLVEVGMVAEAAEIEFQRLALDELGAGCVVDHEMGEIGLAGH